MKQSHSYVDKRVNINPIDEHATEVVASKTFSDANNAKEATANEVNSNVVDMLKSDINDVMTEAIEDGLVSDEDGLVPEGVLISDENTQSTPALIDGYVMDGISLNIRLSPNIHSRVIGILNPRSKVRINPVRSTESFYSVCTDTGITGFCAMAYILYNTEQDINCG